MAGRKEKNVLSQTEKREAKERQKRIEKANATLIPVPKATKESMGLIAFDADGIFRLTENRFVKMFILEEEKQEMNQKKFEGMGDEKMREFKLEEKEEKKKRRLLDVLNEPVNSKIRFTKKFSDEPVKDNFGRGFITLTAGAETLDEARNIFEKDEAALKRHIDITPLSVDDVLAEILSEDADDTSYASLIRAKKDWYKEMPQPVEETENFRLKDMYGQSMFALQYPEIVYENPMDRLRELGCPMIVAVDFERITPEDQIDFIRSMEKRYNRRIPDEKDFDFLNTSLQLMYLCDSDDARQIIEKTILSLYGKEGFILVPAVGMQKDAALSLMSLGLMSENNMRNVPEDVVRKILK